MISLQDRTLKICMISSSGGHLAQLKKILDAVKDYRFFIVTEKVKSTLNLKKNYRTYFLRQQERRNYTFLFNFILNIFISVWIILKEKPDVIITTGAGAVVPLCVIGKLMGAKIVFIESFAKVHSPTLTGRLIYKFANRFYVQWEELKKFYPNAQYKGKVY